MKFIQLITFILLIHLNGISTLCTAQSLPKNYGKVETELFIGSRENKSLVVAFGGSEGGNTFASAATESIRGKFHDRGFHFLSIGYFGDKKLPKKLDRISLNAIYDSIKTVSSRLNIDSNNIVLIGASRGGELALNLASRYDYLGVIALVPSSVSIANTNNKVATSSWTFDNEEIPSLKLNRETVREYGWSKAVEKSMIDEKEYSHASIQIENIRGFIFLSSGKKDELWPSYRMCNDMITRLEKNEFEHPYKHVAFESGHQPSKHWGKVFEFIDSLNLIEK